MQIVSYINTDSVCLSMEECYSLGCLPITLRTELRAPSGNWPQSPLLINIATQWRNSAGIAATPRRSGRRDRAVSLNQHRRPHRSFRHRYSGPPAKSPSHGLKHRYTTKSIAISRCLALPFLLAATTQQIGLRY